MRKNLPRVEWPTLSLLILCYMAWGLGTTYLSALWLPLGFVVTMLAITLHSSLQHEILHGHPFASRFLSEATVFPAPGLFIPYQRFRDTHLAHHQDSILTDPYDDPESNFQDSEIWAKRPAWQQKILLMNNTLAGRLTFGPGLSVIFSAASDLRAIRDGDRAVLMGWLWHIPGVVLVLTWLIAYGQMSLGLYVLAAYSGFSILKIRTFLEHQAHERARARTVIIEDRGPLAFLFLNNNLHVVHHMHPAVPWYRLWDYYRKNKDRYLARNDGYLYSSYGDVFRRYFFARKDPVPHPLWTKGQD
ncbi:fatty acid desaturase [Thalassobius sp. I31.1]|uniref:fatty acid desaturase n=1 Tax=Thalassobius sp. I31.1 TaxID=2109912 RepID=UPI000D1B931B|nr:fatty acid desaturase [Thalassobius sp. I31.1]